MGVDASSYWLTGRSVIEAGEVIALRTVGWSQGCRISFGVILSAISDD